MKPQPPPKATAGAWLTWAEKCLAGAKLAFGQVATNPHDEALYLLLHALGLPLDSGPAVLARRLSAKEEAAVRAIFQRRVEERVPAAYLTREAWLGEHRFHVDERVIIPRSYFVEIIPMLPIWLEGRAGSRDCGSPPGKGKSQIAGVPPGRRPGLHKEDLRFADVCTGSGCLAILLAHQFPGAKVDAIDLSAEALDVARINVRAHRLSRRVSLRASDVFDDVPPVRYDAIISNPPYEPSARVDRLAPEFQAEPRLALDGGADGLDIIRKLLRQAPERLQPRGLLLIEVGGLQAAIQREFAGLQPEWLATEDGSNCICLFREENLKGGRVVSGK